jgi:hypothetical protein
MQKKAAVCCMFDNGAGEGIRTPDPNLGKRATMVSFVLMAVRQISFRMPEIPRFPARVGDCGIAEFCEFPWSIKNRRARLKQ